MLSKGHLETHPSGLRKEILFVLNLDSFDSSSHRERCLRITKATEKNSERGNLKQQEKNKGALSDNNTYNVWSLTSPLNAWSGISSIGLELSSLFGRKNKTQVANTECGQQNTDPLLNCLKLKKRI